MIVRARGGLSVFLLGCALLLSGSAALINEVAWQRSLRRLLGGSEAVASMIVVLVFMAGLGIGSILTSRRVHKWADPLMALAQVESGLAILNVCIAGLFRTDLIHSLVRLQRLGAGIGVPALAVYALTSVLVLLPPCVLMGATMPISSEVCQRRLGLRDPRVLGLIFFANTFGSTGGAILTGFVLMPEAGLSASLMVACGLNLAAGLTLLVLRWMFRGVAPGPPESVHPSPMAVSAPRASLVLIGGLGFCSLGYEMALLRLSCLRDRPFPHTFACVTTGFLLFWSLGAYASSRTRIHALRASLNATAVLVVLCLLAMIGSQPIDLDEPGALGRFFLFRFPFFPACFGFGYLFGKLISTAARRWGPDVGRLSAWNTGGACLGVVLTVLVGYEIHYVALVMTLSLLLLSLATLSTAAETEGGRVAFTGFGKACMACAVLLLAAASTLDLSRAVPGPRLFFGRGGVVGVDPEGNMLWDGLWHSRLSRGGDHVGTKNWFLAVCPVLSHTGSIRRGCVVGLGTGITAATVAKLRDVDRVDVYDSNPTLKALLREYPDGTLHVGENPKIHLLWEDARTGFALRDDSYDVIVTQPFYLRQAGSSLLNSVEFYSLVAERLRPNGIFTVYSNGWPAQAFAVRQTAARVFPYCESFFKGYLIVLSKDPIDLSEETLAARFASEAADPLWQEISAHEETRDAQRVFGRLLDRVRLPWGDGRLVLTDDWPVLEYPRSLEARARRLGYPRILPIPH